MKNLFRFLIVGVIVAAFVFAVAGDAEGSNSKLTTTAAISSDPVDPAYQTFLDSLKTPTGILYVRRTKSMGVGWGLPDAVRWFDRYTGSKMKYIGTRPCPASARCVTIRPKNLPGRYIGYAGGSSKQLRSTIYIDKAAARRYGINRKVERMKVIKHELGHLFGLGHSDSRRNLMYERVDLNTSTKMTANQRATLRGH